jgi:hypothetical protein
LDRLGGGKIHSAFGHLYLITLNQILPCIYLLGLLLLPKQLSQERKAAQTKARGSDAVPLKPSPPGSKKSLRGVAISAPIQINEEEEWKRENNVEHPGTQDVLSDDGHHSLPPVQHAGRF